MDIIDKFLGEAEFTFDTLDVNNAYTIFNQSYIKSAIGNNGEFNPRNPYINK